MVDNWIYSSGATTNYGAYCTGGGVCMIAVRWNHIAGQNDPNAQEITNSIIKANNLSTGTDNKVVTATLTLKCVGVGTLVDYDNATIDIYELVRPWAEMTSSWNYADGSSHLWGKPGAKDANDRGTVLLDTVPVGNLLIGGTIMIDIPVEVAQSWLNNEPNHYGVILVGRDPEAYDYGQINFASTEYTTSSDRPILTIEAVYDSAYVKKCGDAGTVYLAQDFNNDCYVDFKDFEVFLRDWLICTDPLRPECDQYYK